MAPKIVFDHCAQRLGGGSSNFVTFDINLCSIRKSYFWFPTSLLGVTIAASLSGSTRDFLKLSFHMFPYYKILTFSKVKSNLILETSTP